MIKKTAKIKFFRCIAQIFLESYKMKKKCTEINLKIQGDHNNIYF